MKIIIGLVASLLLVIGIGVAIAVCSNDNSEAMDDWRESYNRVDSELRLNKPPLGY